MNRLFSVVAAVTIVAGAVPALAAQEFDLQSVYSLSIPASGPAPQQWAERVEMMTGGAIKIKVHGAGEIVPALEVFGAVSSGAIPIGFDTAIYWADRLPVASLLGAMPFGPEPDVYLSWLLNGGGMELTQKALDAYNVKYIPCQMIAPEAGGWFNREINAVADLQGLNMRIAGLGGKVLGELGVNAQIIPAGEIYVALERGRIDATEFSSPALDVNFGFQEIAKYYYFPGWHQPSSSNAIIVNLDVWNGLEPAHQDAFVRACNSVITEVDALTTQMQSEALAKIEAAGVSVRRFPDEVLAALKEATDRVLAAEAAKDPAFAEAYESIKAYTERNSRLNELNRLPR